jgi:hypothetical protein
MPRVTEGQVFGPGAVGIKIRIKVRIKIRIKTKANIVARQRDRLFEFRESQEPVPLSVPSSP